MAQAQYTITIANGGPLALYGMIFAKMPTNGGNPLQYAWKRTPEPINTNNKETAPAWSLNWALNYSTSEAGWVAGLIQPKTVNPEAGETYIYTYDKGFDLDASAPNKPGNVIVKQLPGDDKPSQIGLYLDGNLAISGPIAAGINLDFQTHPTYYVTLGNFVEGEEVDLETLANSVKVVFAQGHTSATCTWAHGTWTVTYA